MSAGIAINSLNLGEHQISTQITENFNN